MYCYVVKQPVFRLQRGSAKWPIAPSNFSSLCSIMRFCYYVQCGAFWSNSLHFLMVFDFTQCWLDDLATRIYDFLIKFLVFFDTPEIPGCATVVIWNRFEKFLLQCSADVFQFFSLISDCLGVVSRYTYCFTNFNLLFIFRGSPSYLEKTVLHEIRVSGNFISHTWNSVKVCTELYPSSDRSI